MDEDPLQKAANKLQFEQLIKDEINKERTDKMKKGVGAMFALVGLFLLLLWGLTALVLWIIYFFTNVI